MPGPFTQDDIAGWNPHAAFSMSDLAEPTPNWVLQDQSYRDSMPDEPVREIPHDKQDPMWTRSSERYGYFENLPKKDAPRDTLPGNRTPAHRPSVDYIDQIKLGIKQTDDGKVDFLRERFGRDNVFVSEQGKLYVRPDGNDWTEVTPSNLPAVVKTALVVGGTAALSPAAAASPVVAGAISLLSDAADQGASYALPGDDNMSPWQRAKSAIGAGAEGFLGQLGANYIARGTEALKPRNILGREIRKEISTPVKKSFADRVLRGDLSPNMGPLTKEAQEGIDLAKESGVPLSVGRATGSDLALQIEGYLRRGPGGAVLRSSDAAQTQALRENAGALFDEVGQATTAARAGSTVKKALSQAAPLSDANVAAREAADAASMRALNKSTQAVTTKAGRRIGTGPGATAAVGAMARETYNEATKKAEHETLGALSAAFENVRSMLGDTMFPVKHTANALRSIQDDFGPEGLAFAKRVMGSERASFIMDEVASGKIPRADITNFQTMLSRSSRTLRGEGFSTVELTPGAQARVAGIIRSALGRDLDSSINSFSRMASGKFATKAEREAVQGGLAGLKTARASWRDAVMSLQSAESYAMAGVNDMMPGEVVLQKLATASPSDLEKTLARIQGHSKSVGNATRRELFARIMDSAYDAEHGALSPRKLLAMRKPENLARLKAILPPEHHGMLDDMFAMAAAAKPSAKVEPSAIDLVYRNLRNIENDDVIRAVAISSPGRIKRVLGAVRSYDPELEGTIRRSVLENMLTRAMGNADNLNPGSSLTTALNNKNTGEKLSRSLMAATPPEQRPKLAQLISVAKHMATDRYGGSPTAPLLRMDKLLQGIYANIKSANLPGLAMTWIDKRTPEELSILMTHVDGPKSILTLTSPSVTKAQAIHAIERLTAIMGDRMVSDDISTPSKYMEQQQQ